MNRIRLMRDRIKRTKERIINKPLELECIELPKQHFKRRGI